MWFRVDDTLPTHARVLDAGNAAMGLWVRAGAWSMGQLTDGFIPTAAAHMLGSDDEITALVRTGLWYQADGGYQFHKWAEDGSGAPRQPTRAEIEAKRKADRDRKRDAIERLRGKGGRTESATVPSGVAPDSVWNPDGSTPDVRPESQPPSDAPDPTRPDPTQTSLSSTSDEVEEARTKRAPRRRATRIPDEFIVNTDMRTWAATTTPDIDLNRATEKFVNYWRAKSGKDATKLDWPATWRNWMLNEADRAQPRQGRESSLDRRDRQIRDTFATLAALDIDQKAIGQ